MNFRRYEQSTYVYVRMSGIEVTGAIPEIYPEIGGILHVSKSQNFGNFYDFEWFEISSTNFPAHYFRKSRNCDYRPVINIEKNPSPPFSLSSQPLI